MSAVMKRYIQASGASLVVLLLARLLAAQTNTPSVDPQIVNLINQVSQVNIRTHIENLANAGGYESRVSYTSGNRWGVDYIKQAFESFGLTSVVLDTFFVTNATPPYNTEPLFNVVATLEGSEDLTQIYIVGGHLDATGNLDVNLSWEQDWSTAKARGADDNASGIAAILEIARVLSDPANEFRNRYTIQFVAFGAEERHPIYDSRNHLGSRHFVSAAFADAKEIRAAYILDMIGFNGTGSDYFNLVADSRSSGIGVRMLEFNAVYEIGLESNAPPFPASTYSDHDQFWLYRFPAVLLIENAPPWQTNLPWYRANPQYHRQSDSLSTLDLEQIEKIAKLALATVASDVTLVTSIDDELRSSGPHVFGLKQNYPNPFNGGTRIDYSLKSSTFALLDVFNLRGQKITTLVSGDQSAGAHSVVWEPRGRGRELSSGVYFARLQTGAGTFYRKMIFSK